MSIRSRLLPGLLWRCHLSGASEIRSSPCHCSSTDHCPSCTPDKCWGDIAVGEGEPGKKNGFCWQADCFYSAAPESGPAIWKESPRGCRAARNTLDLSHRFHPLHVIVDVPPFLGNTFLCQKVSQFGMGSCLSYSWAELSFTFPRSVFAMETLAQLPLPQMLTC